MFANLLQTKHIWQYEDYLLFKKCGDLTISPDLQTVGYNCLFCLGICLEFDIFLQHLREYHRMEIINLYNKEIITENTDSFINAELSPEANYIPLSLDKSSEFPANELNLIYYYENNFNNIGNSCDLLGNAAVAPLQLDHALLSANPSLATTADLNAAAATTTVIPTLAIKDINSYVNKSNSKLTAKIKECKEGATAISQNNQEEEGDREEAENEEYISGMEAIMKDSPSYTNQIEGGVATATATNRTISSSSGISDCMSSFTEDSSNKSNDEIFQKNLQMENSVSLGDGQITKKFRRERKTKPRYIKTPAMIKAMENRKLISVLIDLYRNCEKLWNPQHCDYKYNPRSSEYNELSQPLQKHINCQLSGNEIFGILIELRNRYRRELRKFQNRNGKHKTKLWFFNKMEFLKDIGKTTAQAVKEDSDKLNIRNRDILSFLIESYREHEDLWNTSIDEYLQCDKESIYEHMAQQLKDRFKVPLVSAKDCANELNKLRTRYRKELRKLYKLKGLYLPKLWCFDEMDFLKPIIREQIFKNLAKKPFLNRLSPHKNKLIEFNKIEFHNLADQLQFIEIYHHYVSLWDQDHPDYRSTNYRRQNLEEMLKELNRTLTNYSIDLMELEKTLYELRKSFSREKQRRMAKKPARSSQISCVIYEKLAEFLTVNIGPFKCDECLEICKTYDQYKIHKSKHDGTAPFICTLCGKGFQMSGNLTIHIRRHRRDFPYSCKTCDKSFATSTEATIHMRSHTGERPYTCNVCEKSFKTWSFCDIHRKRCHLNQSNFHCPICDKQFYERNRFRDHMNLHLNIRKHQCVVCKKGFTTHGNLKKHMEVHSIVRKYTCLICDKRFNQFASLSWHKKTQHP